MKRFWIVLSILISGLAWQANPIYAEVNPLLNIFEALTTGLDGTLAKDVNTAVYAYDRHRNNASRPDATGYIKREIINTMADNRMVIKYTWWDALFDGAKLPPPTAILEITVYDRPSIDSFFQQPILSARYLYTFLNFTNSLKK